MKDGEVTNLDWALGSGSGQSVSLIQTTKRTKAPLYDNPFSSNPTSVFHIDPTVSLNNPTTTAFCLSLKGREGPVRDKMVTPQIFAFQPGPHISTTWNPTWRSLQVPRTSTRHFVMLDARCNRQPKGANNCTQQQKIKNI